MKRRKALQSIALGTLGSGMPVGPLLDRGTIKLIEGEIEFSSQWHLFPDMAWTGKEYWANRLQDWQLRDGHLECLVLGNNRNVHLLTHQITSSGERLSTSVNLKLNGKYWDDFEGETGFAIGLKGKLEGYQSACMTGDGTNIGLDHTGRLLIGQETSQPVVNKSDFLNGINLTVTMIGKEVELVARKMDGTRAGSFKSSFDNIDQSSGNMALLVNAQNNSDNEVDWKVQFSDWKVSGDRIDHSPDHTFGPIYFTQYTLEEGVLKITAQLAPMDQPDMQVNLWFEKGGNWQKSVSSSIRSDSRTAHFRLENWKERSVRPFKVTCSLPLKENTKREFSYEGEIAVEPVDQESIVAMAMSCNGDFGFPDHEVVVHGSKHDPDVLFFLGDQIYERNGGYGVQNNPPYRKADLDFLRKWYEFGWSYRDLFRNRPSICLPDDHDVFHGNVWGEGGEKTIQQGSTKEKQDSGGYKLPADWVNMIQVCQTSHMPDPYDPTPIKQGIGVYYTSWKYGGLDFAIIEDRKFKSAPKNYFPEVADVENGFAQNLKFDFKSFQEPEVLELLGDRQMEFLKEWTLDWTKGVQIKALISATPFMTLQTLPKGTKNDSVTSNLTIPEKGEYVQGDEMTRDMDSNGWPVHRRDEVVKILRKSHAVHIVGDQHIPSVTQYGVKEFGDGNFVFTVPALGNVFPRRWWPPVSEEHRPLIGRPDYTGDFRDGFGNKMTVFAVASPYKSHREPARLYDLVTGYGIVKFNKRTRKIRFECWPRYMDPETEKEGQYGDWPIEVNQSDNFAHSSSTELPRIKVVGLDLPLIKVFDISTGDLVSVVRMKDAVIIPKVPEKGEYKLVVGDPDKNVWKELLLNTGDNTKNFEIDFS